MGLTCSFKFLDDELNRRFISIIRKSLVKHVVDKSEVVHYSCNDEDLVENELIRSIRKEVFPSWQVISCPKQWTDRYRDYMTLHKIPFAEELSDEQLCFLIPRKYRPHAWKLEGEKPQRRMHIAG